MTIADIISVHPGENITLICNITNYSDIFWYRFKSEELKLLISAKMAKVGKDFLPVFNVDESHFDVTNDSSLAIIGVTESDSGFYCCGGQNKKHIQFGKPIALNFTGGQKSFCIAAFIPI